MPEDVLDFGLAQSPPRLAHEDVSDRTTRTFAGGLTGTLAYMSPEQLQGIPADPRSDVFSLGVLFYEMATGRRPFQAKSAAETVSAILRDVPIPPTRLRPGLPGRVDRLITRCLEKEPCYRLQSAVDVMWELEQEHPLGVAIVYASATNGLHAGQMDRHVLGDYRRTPRRRTVHDFDLYQ
jgi:serine/threonine protein kinase